MTANRRRGKPFKSVVQADGQVIQLLVDSDPQRLESPFGRMASLRAAAGMDCLMISTSSKVVSTGFAAGLSQCSGRCGRRIFPR